MSPEERDRENLIRLVGIYRQLPKAEPPAALDAAILAEARAAVADTGGATTPRRKPRIPVVLATAASMVLAVGLAWQVKQSQDAQDPVLDGVPIGAPVMTPAPVPKIDADADADAAASGPAPARSEDGFTAREAEPALRDFDAEKEIARPEAAPSLQRQRAQPLLESKPVPAPAPAIAAPPPAAPPPPPPPMQQAPQPFPQTDAAGALATPSPAPTVPTESDRVEKKREAAAVEESTQGAGIADDAAARNAEDLEAITVTGSRVKRDDLDTARSDEGAVDTRDRAPRSAAKPAPAGEPAPASGNAFGGARADIPRALAAIEALIAEGKLDEARRALAAFRRAHPGATVPQPIIDALD